MERKGGFFLQNKNKLTVHTSLKPGHEISASEKTFSSAAPSKKEASKWSKPQKSTSVRRLSVSERLFRNTAVACALLLCVMALKNIDSPVTNTITEKVKSVVNMDIQFPSSIGNLSFVQKYIPESALVFLNKTDASLPSIPVKGEIVHAYSKAQPWTEYKTENNAPVHSMTDGTIEACVETGEGDWTILVRTENNLQTVYAFLNSACVGQGETIRRGMQIGSTGSNDLARLYLEVRKGGEVIDPANAFEE